LGVVAIASPDCRIGRGGGRRKKGKRRSSSLINAPRPTIMARKDPKGVKKGKKIDPLHVIVVRVLACQARKGKGKEETKANSAFVQNTCPATVPRKKKEKGGGKRKGKKAG